MVSRRYLLVALVTTSLLMGCQSARVLGIFSSPSKSHSIFAEAVTKELAKRGHQVTIVSPFAQEKPLANYTDIVVNTKAFSLGNSYDIFSIQKQPILEQIGMFRSVSVELCHDFLGNNEVQSLINSDEHFDVVMIENFNANCLAAFAHKFAAPLIALSAPGATFWLMDSVGNPSPTSYVPNHVLLPFSDHMCFFQRLVNALTILVIRIYSGLVIFPEQDVIMREYFNNSDLPYVRELEERTSLMLLNSHVTLGYPRPNHPNVIEVGGMHIQKTPKKLPKALQKYLDEATEGVIYFSFGTNAKSANMPEEKLRAFVDAFSKLKQKVLWKWEDETLPGKPSNVKIAKWLPQSSVLAHPNVRVFISHMGLLSFQEAVYRAVPIVGVPIYMDEGWNMLKASELGIGVKLDYHNNVTSESIQWAVKTVTQDPSYRENAKRASALFKDQPTTPLEQAVFWSEYIIRHKGAPHLRSALLDLTWYQYWLLDVIAALAIVICIFMFGFYKVAKKILSLVTSDGEKYMHNGYTDVRNGVTKKVQ